MTIFADFNWWIILSLFVFGLLSGAIAPTFGIGGGILIVPILLLVYSNIFDFDANAATATSLGVIIFTSFSGSLSYIREKRIDFRVAATFMIYAIPGSISGALFSKWLKIREYKIDILQIIFACTMILIAIYKIISLLIQRRKRIKGLLDKDDDCLSLECDEDQANKSWWKQTILYRDFEDQRSISFRYKVKLVPGVFIAFIGGFIGSMLGLGGGVVYVPILTMILGLPIAIATATSTFTILISTPFAVGIRHTHVNWGIVIIMAAGSIITSNIIPRFLYKIKTEWILTGFWILAITAALRLLINVLTSIII